MCDVYDSWKHANHENIFMPFLWVIVGPHKHVLLKKKKSPIEVAIYILNWAVLSARMKFLWELIWS